MALRNLRFGINKISEPTHNRLPMPRNGPTGHKSALSAPGRNRQLTGKERIPGKRKEGGLDRPLRWFA